MSYLRGVAVVTDYSKILQDIKKKAFSPVYLLHGEEPHFTDLLAKAFETDAIDEGGKSFNQQVLYARDLTPGLIVDAASRYPMMADHQLVVIKEAHELSDMPKLVPYLKNPMPSTILVFVYRGKKMKGNTKVYKAIAHSGVVFESKPLYANKVANFVRDQFHGSNYTLESGVADLLAEYMGTELSALSNAIEKLKLNVDQMQPITTADVEMHVGISRQYNLFELQDALGNKNLDRAIRIGYTLSNQEREHPLPVTLASLYSYYAGLLSIHDVLRQSEKDQKEATGIHSSFRLGKLRQAAGNWSREQLQECLLVIAEYDLKSKGVDYHQLGTMGELSLELIERLVTTSVARQAA